MMENAFKTIIGFVFALMFALCIAEYGVYDDDFVMTIFLMMVLIIFCAF